MAPTLLGRDQGPGPERDGTMTQTLQGRGHGPVPRPLPGPTADRRRLYNGAWPGDTACHVESRRGLVAVVNSLCGTLAHAAAHACVW